MSLPIAESYAVVLAALWFAAIMIGNPFANIRIFLFFFFGLAALAAAITAGLDALTN